MFMGYINFLSYFILLLYHDVSMYRLEGSTYVMHVCHLCLSIFILKWGENRLIQPFLTPSVYKGK